MTFISDKRVAILADDGVNQRQLTLLRDVLEKAALRTSILACGAREIKGWENKNWGIRFRVDQPISEAKPNEFDGVVIPGGPLHADRLRENEHVRSFVKYLFGAGKLVAAIGHGVQVLIDADVLRGLKATGSPSIATDIRLAGGLYLPESVVTDNGLITAKNADALEPFSKTLLDTLRKGVQQRSESII